jgi:DUF1680 family protein
MEKVIRDFRSAQHETGWLSAYLQGMADAQQNKELARASEWLCKISRNMCGKGFIGCHGGEKCDSDHK